MARANEAAELVQKSLQEGAGAIHGLRGELSGFAAALEASSTHIGSIEAEYRAHVSNNFTALETECKELRAISTFAAATAVASGPPGTGSASSGSAGDKGINSMEFGLTKNKIDNLEHIVLDISSRIRAVDDVAKEIEFLKEHLHKGNSGDGHGHGPYGAVGAADEDCPHCRHVTQLWARVAELERWRTQQRVAPGAAPQQAAGEFDAWARYNRREPQHVHIGTPPGPRGGRPGAGGDDPSGAGGPTRTGIPGSGGRPVDEGDHRVNYAKLLDEKTASTELFKYAGGDGATGEKWRKAVRGYVGTKCRILLTVIDWAEEMDEQ
jgi:hypothetical protein